jgi:hypothetical protein
MNANYDDEPEQKRVSNHATVRWLQRVNPTEQHPREAIRRAWKTGRRAAADYGTARRSDGAVLVAQGDIITTVLEGTDR